MIYRLFRNHLASIFFVLVVILSPATSNAQVLDKVSRDFISALERNTSHEIGQFKFLTEENCDELTYCYGNNPDSPYGHPLFRTPKGIQGHWHLDSNEAVILIFRTPPEVKYFGFTGYIFTKRYPGIAFKQNIFTSIGDSTNSANIRYIGSSDNPFNKLSAIVMTASSNSYLKSLNALHKAGIKAQYVNRQVIDANTVTMGSSLYTDTFGIMLRLALPTNQSLFESYMNNPPIKAIKVSFNNANNQQLSIPSVRPRGTGQSESYLQQSLDNLGMAIKAQHGSTNEEVFQYIDPNREECINTPNLSCIGDSPDALYGGTGSFKMDSNNDYIIIYGVNHAVTGKSSYSNIAVYKFEGNTGVSSYNDEEIRGSAEQYLPNDQNAKYLYAIKIARTCTANEEHCYEIPSTGSLSIPLDDEIVIGTRAYLEKATKTGPSPNELLPSRLLNYSD